MLYASLPAILPHETCPDQKDSPTEGWRDGPFLERNLPGQSVACARSTPPVNRLELSSSEKRVGTEGRAPADTPVPDTSEVNFIQALGGDLLTGNASVSEPSGRVGRSETAVRRDRRWYSFR
jgi:hypothetical protein